MTSHIHPASRNIDVRTGNVARPFIALTRLPRYFITRYYLCALFFACILFYNIEHLRAIEGELLRNMLVLSGLQSFYTNGFLVFTNVHSLTEIRLPVITQILFLIVFPTYAAVSRINLKMRAEFLLFGGMCFLLFIVLQFLTIIFANIFGIKIDGSSFQTMTILTTAISGGLMIEFALFSILTKPAPLKIKAIVKRTYIKEYLYLFAVLTCTFLVLSLILNLLQVQQDSPIVAVAFLGLNIGSIISFANYFSYFFYETRIPKWLKRGTAASYQNANFSVSFLVAAYNEEKILRNCIESIDMAASKYTDGKVEIVLVNDGSTDNTAKIATKSFENLNHCTGKLFTIPNSGKGAALRYGLEKTSGDIIFRIDGDTMIDEDAIKPTVLHFNDPQVGTVSGMFVPLNLRNLWQRSVSLYNFLWTFNKRAQELVDSIIVQAGAFSVFRKDALVKVGGWVDNQFGEDGEITSRLSRFGYKAEYEPLSIAHNDVQPTLRDIIYQRARWGVAFYHSRGRNLAVVREFQRPRWIVFLGNLLEHGVSLAGSLIFPYLAAAIITGVMDFSGSIIPFVMLSQMAVILLIIYGVQALMISYNLAKFKRLAYIRYFPLMRILMLIIIMYVKPQITEAVLAWSSKWPEYNYEAYKDLKRTVRKSIDPHFKA
jgi:cellulose synthase/poly-beta-1,6-N-acetylglucosamine synthase-like glycosyltransferase